MWTEGRWQGGGRERETLRVGGREVGERETLRGGGREVGERERERGGGALFPMMWTESKPRYV